MEEYSVHTLVVHVSPVQSKQRAAAVIHQSFLISKARLVILPQICLVADMQVKQNYFGEAMCNSVI